MLQQLPVPVGGSITHILHLADIHIRDDGIEDFSRVFKRLIAYTASLEAVKGGKAVALIAGDVFDHKSSVRAGGLKLFGQLVGGLAQLLPVYIIRGNHDYRQDEARDAPDRLGALVALLQDHLPVAYLDRTGSYIAGNVGFGLVAIQDALEAGNTVGYERTLPSFPSAAVLETPYKIALFHGAVTATCPLADGRTVSGVPLEWFGEGYDALLLGDIHNQFVRNAVGTIHTPLSCFEDSVFITGTYSWAARQPHAARQPRAPGEQGEQGEQYGEAQGCGDRHCPQRHCPQPHGYPGSLLQKDMGEPVLGHGFLLWNLQDRQVSIHHVRNDSGLITLQQGGAGREWQVRMRSVYEQRRPWWSLMEAVSKPWFPKEVSVRVVSSSVKSNSGELVEVKRMLEHCGLTVKSIYAAPAPPPPPPPPSTSHHMEAAEKLQNEDYVTLAACNTVDKWVEYINNSGTQPNMEGLAQILRDPLLLQVPLDDAPAALTTKIQGRNTEIVKILEPIAVVSGGARAPLKLLTMEWAWILCYGSENWFDFRTLENKVGVLAAKNGWGKTSIMETVCWGVFGEGLPSREVRDQSASLLCSEKPAGQGAFITVTVDVGGEIYRIHRPFDTQKEGAKLSTGRSTVQKQCGPDGPWEAQAQGNLAVAGWVHRNIGTLHQFLMSSMLTQYNDGDFFGCGATDQVAVIDRAIGMDRTLATTAAINKAINIHRSVLGEVDAMHAGVLSRHPVSNTECSVEQAQHRLQELQNKVERLEERERHLRGVWQPVLDCSDPLVKSALDTGDTILLQCSVDNVEESSVSRLLEEVQKDIRTYVDRGVTFASDGVYNDNQEELKGQLEDLRTAEPHTPTLTEAEVVELQTRIDAALQGRACDDVEKEVTEAHAATGVLEASVDMWAQRVTTLELELKIVEGRLTKHAASQPRQPELDLISSSAVLELEVLNKTINESGDAHTVLSALLKDVPNKPQSEYSTQGLIDAARQVLVSKSVPLECAVESVPLECAVDAHTLLCAEQAADEAFVQANALRSQLLSCPQPRTQNTHSEYTKWVEAGEKLFVSWDPEVAACVLKTSQGCMAAVEPLLADVSRNSVELDGVRNALAGVESEAQLHPYNPECQACRSQPVRRQIEGLRERDAHLTAVLQGLQDKITSMLRRGLRAKENGGLKPPKGVKSATTNWLLEAHKTRITTAQALLAWSTQKEFWQDELNTQEQYERVKSCAEAAEKLWNERREVVEGLRWRQSMAALTAAEETLQKRVKWETMVLDAEERCISYEKALERRQLITNNMALFEAWDAWSGEHAALVAEEAGKKHALQEARTRTEDARALYKAGLERERNACIARDLVVRLLPDVEKLQRETALWNAWKPWKQLMDTLTLLYLKGEEARLLQIKRAIVLKRAVEVWLPAKKEWMGVVAELDDAKKEVLDLHRKQGAADEQRKAAEAVMSAAESISCYARMLHQRLVVLQQLDSCMSSFRGWVYQHCVGPLLESDVNSVLELLQAGDNRRIRLVARWRPQQEVFGWYLKDEQCACAMPLAKAGGFQRASVSLGMRIALARLGGSGVTSKHLFIDEGFVACDAENLARVPEFLRGLLGSSYDTILLVSHVETIKESADVWIPIERWSYGKSVLSRVQYGSAPSARQAGNARQPGR